MSKKKICFFVSTDRHNKEVLIFRQAKALRDYGYSVGYVVSDNEEDVIIEDLYLYATGYKAKSYLSRIFIAPYFLLRKLISLDADIYQTCSLDQILVCLFLKLKGKKIIFHLREAHPYTFLRKKGNALYKKIIVTLMACFMKYTLKLFDAVIVVTYDIYDYLKNWGIERLYVQGNFPYVNPNYSLSLEEYRNRDNCIIYFGSIYANSCQNAMLDALSNINDVKYLVAGKFWNNVQYRAKLENHPKWKDVDFVDGFNVKDLPILLKKATISNVLRDFSDDDTPNGSIGIIKIFESMEAALPIICSDVPVYRDIMRDYKCGILVNPKDSEQIRKAIEYLITNKDEAWKMGQEGRRAIMERYNWEIISKEYCSIITNMF